MLDHRSTSSSGQPSDILDISYFTNTGEHYSSANFFLAQRHARLATSGRENRVVGRVFWTIIHYEGHYSSLVRGVPLLQPLLPDRVALDANDPIA